MMLTFNKYLKPILQTSLLLAILVISACNDTELVNPINKTESKSKEKLQSFQLQLKTNPINKDEFLGLIVPKIKKAAPCPYLSDDTAMKTVKKGNKLKLRESSNKHCYWSKNLGFSIELSIEPLATAKPPSKRAYNLDVAPVIKPQLGPGKNAVILLDTAWEKELAYAFAFEQDSKLITIFVTGLSTDVKKLTIAAKEVASNLSNPSLSIPLEAAQNNIDGFDICSIWSKNKMQTLIGTPVKVIKGNLDCKWESGANDDFKQINVRISSGKYINWDYLTEIGGVKVPKLGEGAMLIKMRKKKNMPEHVVLNILYNEKLVNIIVTKTILNFKEIALALSENIDRRLE